MRMLAMGAKRGHTTTARQVTRDHVRELFEAMQMLFSFECCSKNPLSHFVVRTSLYALHSFLGPHYSVVLACVFTCHTIFADCAACEPDYSPSLSHTCTRCSSSRRQGLMAATVIAALVLACAVVAIVQYLISTQQLEERDAGCFRRRILAASPVQALKIIVVVWQILTQVCARNTYVSHRDEVSSAFDLILV